MLSPLETGTTWGRPRERGRSRETGPSSGYLAPAAARGVGQGQATGRPGAARPARPPHLIHGGAWSDSARRDVLCQDRHAGHPPECQSR